MEPEFLGISAVAQLRIFALLMFLALGLCLWLPSRLRSAGWPGPASEPGHLAYLGGGMTRYIECQLTELYSRKIITVTRRRSVIINRSARDGRGPVASAILSLTSPASNSEIARSLRSTCEKVGEQLILAGLLIDRQTALKLRFWQSVPFLVLFGAGLAWLLAGTLDQLLSGQLLFLLGLTALAASVRFMFVDHRTTHGLVALNTVKRRFARLALATTREDAPLAVALFGTSVLSGTSLEAIHGLRRHEGNSGCGGGCSSDDAGGGGGCGGGCGGGGCGS